MINWYILDTHNNYMRNVVPTKDWKFVMEITIQLDKLKHWIKYINS